jgi:hypothetical protein
VWGTEYDASADLFKIPLNVEKTGESVEIFKISLLPQNNNTARLVIEWEFYRAWIDFEITK